ncbi:hypothetical protein [Actinoplanes sp. NPDC089786]|uniref:hypothetical protein n=1 Tax=Actinoplanes sp. NPDC089786 TaxID=3155185 RepID=UPI003419279B
MRTLMVIAGFCVLLAGCESAAPPSSSSSPSPAASASASPTPSLSAPPTPSSEPFDKFSAQIGAADVLLSSCIPRFTGDQTEWCTGSQMWGWVNDVTTDLKNDMASRPDSPPLTDVLAAITSLDKSAGTMKQQCDHVLEQGWNCQAAFDDLMVNWRRLEKATRLYN